MFQVPGLYFDAMARKIVRDIEVVGSQEPLGLIIHKISREVIPDLSLDLSLSLIHLCALVVITDTLQMLCGRGFTYKNNGPVRYAEEL